MGRNYCSIVGCHNTVGKIGRFGYPVIMHNLPTNKILRDAWVQAINRENFTPGCATLVCSDHFPGGRGRSWKHTVPTLFLSHLEDIVPSLLPHQEHMKITPKAQSEDTTKELRLKEVDFCNNISKALYEMQKAGCLCDVTINTLNEKIYIHRLVLVSMTTPLCLTKGSVDKLVYKFKTLCRNYESDVVLPLVKYMYTGEIRVKMELVEDFLHLCKLLDLGTIVSGLQKLIPQYCYSTYQVLDTDNETSNDSETNEETSPGISVHIENVEGENGPGPCMYIKDSSNISSEIKQELVEANDQEEGTVSLPIKQEPIEMDGAQNDTRLQIKREFIENEMDEGTTIETTEYSLPPEVKIEYVGDDREPEQNEALAWPGQSSLNEEHGSPEQAMCTSMVLEPNDVKMEENVAEAEDRSSISQSLITEEVYDEKGQKRCNFCFQFFKKDKFTQHTYREHNIQACSICNWTGKDPQQLLNHILEKHNTPRPGKKALRQIICRRKGCHFRTTYMKHLQEHQKTHENAYAVCDVCGKNFDSRSGYRQHVLSHKKEQFSFCDKCHEVKDRYKIHTCVDKKKKKTVAIKPKVLTIPVYMEKEMKFCTKCPFKSVCRQILNQHMIVEHGGLPPFALKNVKTQESLEAFRTKEQETSKQTQQEQCEEPMDVTVKSEAVEDFQLHQMPKSLDNISSIQDTEKITTVTTGSEENNHLSPMNVLSSFKDETRTDSLADDTFKSSSQQDITEEDKNVSPLIFNDSGSVDVKTENTYVSLSTGAPFGQVDVIAGGSCYIDVIAGTPYNRDVTTEGSREPLLHDATNVILDTTGGNVIMGDSSNSILHDTTSTNETVIADTLSQGDSHQSLLYGTTSESNNMITDTSDYQDLPGDSYESSLHDNTSEHVDVIPETSGHGDVNGDSTEHGEMITNSSEHEDKLLKESPSLGTSLDVTADSSGYGNTYGSPLISVKDHAYVKVDKKAKKIKL